MKDQRINVKLDSLDSTHLHVDGFELQVGNLLDPVDSGETGPTPRPSIATLRSWDHRLLDRYRPVYTPDCDFCCRCAYGKCDLSRGKSGACGIDMSTQQARRMLGDSVIGAAAHASHATHVLEYALSRTGPNHPVDMGDEVDIEAPIVRTVLGTEPENLGDLVDPLRYAKLQVAELVSSLHTGQESHNLDYESKALHAGLMDTVAMEVSDLAQVSALDLPKGDPEPGLVEIGTGAVDDSKPGCLFIGHNVAAGARAADYLEEKGLAEDVELAGLCCSAQDLGRYRSGSKIVGPMSKTLPFLRSGRSDVVVLDMECVRLDSVEEALERDSRVVVTTDQLAAGLPDRTDEEVETLVDLVASGEELAVAVLDPEKAGEVAARVALKLDRDAGSRDALETASECVDCGLCRRACPEDLPVDAATFAAGESELEEMAAVYEDCVGCARCEPVCPRDLPVLSIIQDAGEAVLGEPRHKIRAGRGPIKDTEIRKVGRPIVMGEIPGVVGFVGCSNYPRGENEVGKLIDEFAARKYIVATSGCAAQDAAAYSDGDGNNLYEKYPGDFDAGGLVNTGSCVSNSHIIGAAIKIANIFAKKPLEGNFEEIADYILNRVGAVGVVWGTYANKAESIANGCIRWGIPVVMGPHGLKHRRSLMGQKEDRENWVSRDVRTGEETYVGPAPKDMWYVAETAEDAAVAASRLVMRPSDTPKGRQIKLNNYISLHRKFFGTLPDDLHLFVRREGDVPLTYKAEVAKRLEEADWEPVTVPGLGTTLYDRFVVGGK